MVRRFSEAKTYDAPNHRGCAPLRLFGAEAGGTQNLIVGISHFLPGGGAGPDASPPEKVYFVLAGELTVIAGGKETVLKKNDSCFIGPNENREIVNRGNEICSILVAIAPARSDAAGAGRASRIPPSEGRKGGSPAQAGMTKRRCRVRRFPQEPALAVRRQRQDGGRDRSVRGVRRARRESTCGRRRQCRDRRRQCRRTAEGRRGLQEAWRQGRSPGEAPELGSELRGDRESGGGALRPARHPRRRLGHQQGGQDRRSGGGGFSRSHRRQRHAVLADGARGRPADDQARAAAARSS